MAQNQATPETAIVETVQPAQSQPVTPAAAPATPEQETKVLKLTGAEVFDIDWKGTISYKQSTKRGADNKTFERYAYLDIAFPVPSDHPFNQDFKDGKVTSITLIRGVADVERVDPDGNIVIDTDVPTLTFSSYINKSQWDTVQANMKQDAQVQVELARAQFAIAKFKTLKTESVSADFLNALLNASA